MKKNMLRILWPYWQTVNPRLLSSTVFPGIMRKYGLDWNWFWITLGNFCIQSNSVITKSRGPAKRGRYNRDSLAITVKITVVTCHFGTRISAIFCSLYTWIRYNCDRYNRVWLHLIYFKSKNVYYEHVG